MDEVDVGGDTMADRNNDAGAGGDVAHVRHHGESEHVEACLALRLGVGLTDDH
jgi:hypothetical protein